MRVLLSAFNCAPHGSEPGIGWGVATQVAAAHDTVLLTATENREVITREWPDWLPIRVEYVAPPRPLRRVPGGPLHYPAYVAWQRGAARRARALHASDPFDLVHHVTYGSAWMPSFLGSLGPPFVWSSGIRAVAPRALLAGLSTSAHRQERVRYAADATLGRAVRRQTGRRAAIVLTAADASAAGPRGRQLLLGGLAQWEIDRLAALPIRPSGPLRIATIGRLLGWKGVHLGLHAVAALRAAGVDAGYAVIGDGPERATLEALAAQLGVADRVEFTGWLDRGAVMDRLADIDVVLHPSLHEQFGFALVEAIAAGRPVVALATGAPAHLVTAECGRLVPLGSFDAVVAGLVAALRELADPAVRVDLAARARRQAAEQWTWKAVGARLLAVYDEAVALGPGA